MIRTQHINKKTRFVISCWYEALQVAKQYWQILTNDISKDVAIAWDIIEKSWDYNIVKYEHPYIIPWI